MVTKNIAVTFLAGLLIILMSFNVLAVTASIGNSRMVLRIEPDQTIERYVLVKNANEVPVTIDLTASGDLADNIKFEDAQFNLASGEEKKAYFSIFADEEGTTESAVNVRFTPAEGNGVGLSSAIVVVAKKEITNPSEDLDYEFDPDGYDDNVEVVPVENEPREDNSSFRLRQSGIVNPESKVNIGDVSPLVILGFSTGILLLVFIGLLLFASRKKKVKETNEKVSKKKVRRSNE